MRISSSLPHSSLLHPGVQEEMELSQHHILCKGHGLPVLRWECGVKERRLAPTGEQVLGAGTSPALAGTESRTIFRNGVVVGPSL